MRTPALLACLLAAPLLSASAQQRKTAFTHADTLRGSNTPQRAWWDASFYDLHVAVNPADSSIRGWNGITYRVLSAPPADEMQIDLQVPLEVDSMVQDGRHVEYRRDGNAFFAKLQAAQRVGSRQTIAVYYHGKPRVARRPPWDGGFTWTHDSSGATWIATSNEGLGASVWWPNKDYLADEPDSQRIAITVPDPMIDVSNGRLRRTVHNADHTTTYEWFVADPINNYDVEVNAGDYVHFADTYGGEGGLLTLDFWPLRQDLAPAKRQWQQVVPMLICLEHWFGEYPWYRDGYKLVQAPHLGMEHQSGVAYGNHFQNGYLGRDLSHTGLGLGWDFIIVHESAHEWFGNNITDKDAADMWIHESFANYAESLFEECRDGKAAGARYVIGTRANVQNDIPIIGHYNVNVEGSGDMYYKGGNMLHTIRQVVDDDATWRDVLRGLNKTFWHQTVTTQQIENYIAKRSGKKLDKIFDEYLRTTKIPELEYRIEGRAVSYRWANVVPGFDMPIRVTLSDSGWAWIHPTEQWQRSELRLARPDDFKVDENFYVIPKRIAGD